MAGLLRRTLDLLPVLVGAGQKEHARRPCRRRDRAIASASIVV